MSKSKVTGAWHGTASKQTPRRKKAPFQKFTDAVKGRRQVELDLARWRLDRASKGGK